jgi:hypothetical protein
MSHLRFFLILLLTVALDLSVPVPSEAREAIEEFEEATTRHRARRSYRLVRDVTAPTEREATVSPRSPRVCAAAVAAVRRPVVVAFAPKQPPPLAKSPASPDAH